MKETLEKIQRFLYRLGETKRGDLYILSALDYQISKKLITELELLIEQSSQQAVEADATNLCEDCKRIGRNGEHSWFCRKCGAPLN